MATKIISPVNVDFRKNLDIRPGDTVRVWQKIEEAKGKFRLQAFEGIVLACKHGTEAGATFTVRKVVDSVGVERIFPLYSPMIDSVELVRRSKVRRAKLYFVREKATKEIRRQMRRIMNAKYDEEPTAEAAPAEAPKEAPAAEAKK
jgi:large subunit ribosomal protein L19